MKTAAKKKSRSAAQPFRATLAKTQAGSPYLDFNAGERHADIDHRRERNAVIYRLAARIEELSEDQHADWAVTVEAWTGRIIIEIAHERQAEAAVQVLAAAARELGVSR